MKTKTPKPYLRNVAVWIALLLLLGATTASAYIVMGIWNSVANLAIAAVKVLLIALYFMHLRHADGLVRLAALVAVFVLVLLFSLAAVDYLTRGLNPAPWQAPQLIPR